MSIPCQPRPVRRRRRVRSIATPDPVWWEAPAAEPLLLQEEEGASPDPYQVCLSLLREPRISYRPARRM